MVVGGEGRGRGRAPLPLPSGMFYPGAPADALTRWCPLPDSPFPAGPGYSNNGRTLLVTAWAVAPANRRAQVPAAAPGAASRAGAGGVREARGIKSGGSELGRQTSLRRWRRRLYRGCRGLLPPSNTSRSSRTRRRVSSAGQTTTREAGVRQDWQLFPSLAAPCSLRRSCGL